MKMKLSVSCLMLAGALCAPVAMAAPEMNRATTTLLALDVPAMTGEQLKERMNKIEEALKGDNVSAVRSALGGVAISGLAISDEQAKAIADQLKAWAAKYPNHAAQIKTNLFRVEHLTIGREAPNIEGKDIEGGKIQLADFRGKVVVVDFFGDW